MRVLGSFRLTGILAGCASMLAVPAVAPAHHGPPDGHLPPVEQNLELVGELEPMSQGPIVQGQIADLAVHDGHAYLNSWDEPSCTKGGFYVVDIRNPAAPVEVAFEPAVSGYYHGEGAHVIDMDTPQFTGDLLAVNNETCTENLPAGVDPNSGGFDLYDVSDPANPVPLVQNAGDPDVGDPANSYHSVFVWQQGTRAFLVASDNTEFEDVDIFDITDPAAPVQIGDHDLLTEFPQIEDDLANGNLVLNHDMIVKQVGSQMRMLVSYWDAGYVQLDVTDPANPVYITDTNFDDPDPLLGFDPPEGNAHQAEYSHDNEFVLAADEDFSPERLDTVEITTGPNAGDYPGNSIGGAAPLSSLPDEVLNGPTVYGGYGCDASAPIPPRATAGLPPLGSGEEAIVVLQRGPDGNDPGAPEGACFPGEKAANAIEAGYDAVLLVNHHAGEAGGVFCGSGGFPPTPPIVAACTTHEAFHHIFNTPPATDIPYDPADEPAIGDLGEKVSVTGSFDGWGYAHLYDAATSEELDAFAIRESLDERYATGFGDLSIHEFATDPQVNLAYSSYYTGGVRVLQFSRAGGLQQTGAYIDDEGSNFWGIEQFTTPAGQRLIAGSDRDFGLQIFRYTGPGAPTSGAGGGDGGGEAGDDDQGGAPDTEFTKKPRKATTKRKAKFRFVSSEPNSGFECKFDRGDWKACESPFKKRVGRAKHKFKVRAIDAAGNVDPFPAKYRWKVVKRKRGGKSRDATPSEARLAERAAAFGLPTY